MKTKTQKYLYAMAVFMLILQTFMVFFPEFLQVSDNDWKFVFAFDIFLFCSIGIIQAINHVADQISLLDDTINDTKGSLNWTIRNLKR